MKYFSSRFALSLTSQLTGDLIEKSVSSWIYFFQVYNYNKSQDDFSALLIVTWLLQRSLLPILLLDTAIGSISLPDLLCFICFHPPTTWISLIIQPSELHLVSPFYPILLFYNFTSKLLKNSQEFLPQNRYLHKFCRSNYISILFVSPPLFAVVLFKKWSSITSSASKERFYLNGRKIIELVFSVLLQLDNCHS